MQYDIQQRARGHRSHEQEPWVSSGGSVVESSRPQRPTRVLIADRHAAMRAGVRVFLEGEKDLDVVGEAGHAEEVLSEARRTKPHVVLLESWLAGGLDADLVQRLHAALPSVRIISVMGDDAATAFRSAVEGGAQGYLGRNTSQVELVRAIRAVAKGEAYLGPESVNQAFRLLRQQRDTESSRSGLDSLSPQERRVIVLLAEGNTNKEIAVKLRLSDKTVKNYLANMFTKLAVERRAQAVALYFQAQRAGGGLPVPMAG